MLSIFAASKDTSAYILIRNRKTQKMITRTNYVFQAFAILSLFAISNSASAQSYHRPIRHIEKYSNVADSSETPRLKMSIQQQDKANLKYRIAVLNPLGRTMNISILKNDDVLFSENT